MRDNVQMTSSVVEASLSEADDAVNTDSAVSPDGTAPDASTAFGIDAFTADDRLRLFHFAAADKRHDYLWLLRAFDRGRANYQVLLHASDARDLLAGLADEYPAAKSTAAGDTQSLLDSLSDWKVLDRSYDGTRAANLAEYRNRHHVYQFTQAGYRAFQAVEEVLGATLEDAQLSRLVFPDILADLRALAQANSLGDGDEVYRKLARLDGVLSDMAQRAARFYLMLGDLARTNDTRPEVFLAHKDTLLSHMREFTAELARFTPMLAGAVRDVEATGAEQLIERAAAADERLFRSAPERVADWRQRWAGLVHWFAAGEHSESDRLQDATITAISGVLALLRRVTDAKKGGVSRESQLRHLAQWFVSCPTDADAHALFRAAFDLGSPRHIAVQHADPELIASRQSWWTADAVELSRTLVQSGRAPALHGPGRVDRADAQRQHLRALQLKAQAESRTAAASLASDGVYGRMLDEPETRTLLGLLDLALAARVPVSAGVKGHAAAHSAAHPAARSFGVRMTLIPADGSTTVHTVRGRLHLDGLRLEITGGSA